MSQIGPHDTPPEPPLPLAPDVPPKPLEPELPPAPELPEEPDAPAPPAVPAVPAPPAVPLAPPDAPLPAVPPEPPLPGAPVAEQAPTARPSTNENTTRDPMIRRGCHTSGQPIQCRRGVPRRTGNPSYLGGAGVEQVLLMHLSVASQQSLAVVHLSNSLEQLFCLLPQVRAPVCGSCWQ